MLKVAENDKLCDFKGVKELIISQVITVIIFRDDRVYFQRYNIFIIEYIDGLP